MIRRISAWGLFGLVTVGTIACAPDHVYIVGTFNIRWDDGTTDAPTSWVNRRDAVLQQAQRFDLLALQEVMPSQAEAFEALPDHVFVGGPGNLGLLVRHGFEAVSLWDIALSTGEYDRYALCASIMEANFCSVHANGDRTSEDLAALQAHFGVEPTRLIIAGDFNRIMSANPWMTPGGSMLSGGLMDAVGNAIPDNRVPSGCGWGACPEFDFDARVDWILTSPDLEVRSATIAQVRLANGLNISDHWPVSVEVRL